MSHPLKYITLRKRLNGTKYEIEPSVRISEKYNGISLRINHSVKMT